MSVLTLLLYIFYLLAILITIIILITIFPLNISFLSNVNGFYYDAKFNVGILLGFLNGSAKLHPDGGSFRIFFFSIPIYSSNWIRGEKKSEEKESEKKTEDKPKKRKRDFRILIKPLRRLFDSVIQKINVKKLDISLKAGLSDPYLSGMTFGIIYPFIETMKVFFPVLSFSLTPIFVEERFKSRVDGSISLIIILFVIPLLRFFLSKEYRRYRKL